MAHTIRSIRGMPDLLPPETWRRQQIENTARDVLESFGYQEIRLPLLENTELFCRSVGEHTDIVAKEMYTLTDRDGDSITLRPEGTAGTVRACLQHGMIYNQSQRLWYSGPMFRYERPQKGRYRQFEQIGAEAFGIPGSELDAELIQMCHELFRKLGIDQAISLEINSIGTPQSRSHYREALVDYLSGHREQLDPDSQRRLENNPLRILDSKDPQTQSILDQGPVLADYLDPVAGHHFALLQSILSELEIPYRINPKLVRGLDYYTHTVFEFVTSALGAQGTVCGGGRYDGLVTQLGGRPTPGAGFAMGVDRVSLLHEALSEMEKATSLDLVCLVDEEARFGDMLSLCQFLRATVPGLKVNAQRASGKFKNQIKRAERAGANWVLNSDPATDRYLLRWVQQEHGPQKLTREELQALLSEHCADS